MAVDHWTNHGRRYSFTMKALGYPGRKTLTDWVRAKYPEARKCVTGKEGRPAATLSTKREAVYELCTRTGSAQELAGKLDVDRVTLYNWKNQLLGREAPASMKRDNPSSAADKEGLERQIEKFQRDIRNLQLEHDLLKKANDLLKNDLGVDLQLLSNREKAMLVDALKDEYGISALFD